VTAVLARCSSVRENSLRKNAPSAEAMRDKLMVARFGAWRTRLLERGVRADRYLPPRILVPGQRSSKD